MGDSDREQNPKRATYVSLEAAGLELLVRQLERDPGVEHGGPQFGPNQVVVQAEDLRHKLGGSVGGEDGRAAEACRGKRARSQGWTKKRKKIKKKT